MHLKRSTHKKNSIEIFQNESSQEELEGYKKKWKQLTPKSCLQSSSEEESEAAIKDIIKLCYKPSIKDLSPSIQQIKASTSAKTEFQERKKAALKMKLVQSLKTENLSKLENFFKDSTSTNKTASTLKNKKNKEELSDDSLVNLESGDESRMHKKNW